MGELFERFLREGDELDVITRSDFYPPGTATSRRARPGASELSGWQALLDAVADATRRMTMFEVGAGFGRWTVFAARFL